ncbi:MotA/TolQ/ExbB proton channel family protein [Chondromyces apiculatus]|uniref:MotA/TolQ/ExbB proton channel family protein n=1 Tax=Chondromyces apiculatus DSM 436 TaxID=1192034 RepID=A0A017T6I9_9BACT|nr:MotA/TolQ/ExbB proton channel family protein [Chondromyces apiculatus]EYF04607.1 MotA/TolQ/ExbB proton channel family protein [Chondromyces apiculatus DSM 436]
MMQFDLAHIWASMGLLSRLVAFALVIMGLASIAVVVERVIALARLGAETRRFAAEARPLMEVWDTASLVEVAERYRLSALARLMAASVRRYERALGEGEGGVPAVELARREAGRRREAIGADLRRGLNVLASVGSVAPFVGLLGTVIGIITAFQTIASSGSGGLGAVSAGISEALIVTALGLAVAIPAVLCFNYLSARISAVELSLERSAGELIDEMENEHGRHSGEHEIAKTAA